MCVVVVPQTVHKFEKNRPRLDFLTKLDYYDYQ